ncbi:hypothetical protein [Kitasatospora sp. DSM 101779]|uniref:hypothetical protein n=1 Tax=Kitasatospora sp. DSM 101779 TaxID=2853165 RepID=UPI0021D84B73|nr:hypothetical protein [Kitasatospora sp. DSM 101779]MCU7825121.1 hypothetical protein [Kitasatospora sp. DSM 101779]
MSKSKTGDLVKEILQYIAAGIAIAIAVAAISLLFNHSEAPNYSPSYPTEAPSISNQVTLQSAIVEDRNSLFNGILLYAPLDPVKVGTDEELKVTLIATGNNPVARFPDSLIVGSRELKVGGTEEAILSTRDKIDIPPIGPTKGLIGQPGDRVEWRWTITPREAGNSILNLTIVTYQGSTSNPLFATNPPIEIKITAKNTWKNRLAELKGWVIGASTVIAAIATILAFFREPIFGRLARRRRGVDPGEDSNGNQSTER